MCRGRDVKHISEHHPPPPPPPLPPPAAGHGGLKGLLFMTGVTSTFHPSSKWCKDCLVCDIYVAQPRVQAVSALSAPC